MASLKDPVKQEARRIKKNESAKLWRATNRELTRQRTKERYRKNSAAIKAKVHKWRKEHPEHTAQMQRVCKLRSYGLTIQNYNEMLESQNNCCAICSSLDTRTKRSAHLTDSYYVVDHDHKTGLVRGLLCGHCNTALGLFNDSVENLRKAIEYLERHKNK